MNQRNIQNQNQVQQMTQEELQKTQVLNLQDVEETIRFEKKTSKKPAIIVATIGVFSILFGSAFPFAQQLLTKPEPNNNKVEERVIEKKINPESNLNCTYTALNNQDGTDTILNINLIFNYDKLAKITKTFTINPTVGAPLGPTTIAAYITGYQPFLASQIPGYQLTAVPVNNGLIVTSAVDFTIFNPATLPELHKSNIATSVEYQADTTKQAIYSDLTTKGYNCQEK